MGNINQNNYFYHSQAVDNIIYFFNKVMLKI